MALLGTETLQVVGTQPSGSPAATAETVTTAAVAATLLLNGGTFSATGATAVAVPATSVDVNSHILISMKSPLGTVGAQPTVLAITASTGFSVIATASDNSTYNFVVLG